MKLADIKEGAEYADTYGRKMTVEKVGVEGWASHGRAGLFKSTHSTYVAIKRPHGSKDTVHCRSFLHTWAHQEAIDKARKEETEKSESRVIRLWGILEEYTELKRPDWADTTIRLNTDQVEKICEALKAK